MTLDTARPGVWIDGAWTTGSGEDVLEVVNPATEQIVGQVTAGDASDVDRAVQAAQTALASWSALPVARRADHVEALAAGLEKHREALAAQVTAEMGMPIEISKMIQVDLPAATYRMYADIGRTYDFNAGEIGTSLVVREPVGVVGCILPWNFPLFQLAQKVGAALVAGCTVVVKPSELTPISACMFADIVGETGLPPGVFNMVNGTGAVVGEAVARHPDISMVSFTGSTRAGSRVAELASGTVKRVALELGGKSANIVLDDADFHAAAADALAKCFVNSGQTCAALTRLLVPRGRVAEMEDLLSKSLDGWGTGDPSSSATVLGPLANSAQYERVRGHLAAALTEGARVVARGPEPDSDIGYFVPATILSDVTPEMRIAQDEVFGPVLVIMAFDDEEDAVRIANSTPYGLSGGVWAGDLGRALDVAKQLRTGQVGLNGAGYNPAAPFGGYGLSGYGREGGVHGLEEFLQLKSIQRPDTAPEPAPQH